MVPNVLSIAGSDPTGGAGIQADLKTFAALGVNGCAVPVALTAQNSTAVTGVFAVPSAFIIAQLEALFADVDIAAVKIGMLGCADSVRVVAAALREFGPRTVVLDPVLRASTGAALLDEAAIGVLRDELLPLARVITPNAMEAGALLGIAPPRSLPAARDAARRLLATGVGAVLLTGGHVEGGGGAVIDVLDDGAEVHEISVPRVSGGGTHGTGCTLSSAIAALLAGGDTLPAACAKGQRFVAAAIGRGNELRVGRGAGPVHQLGDLWERSGPAGR